MDHKSLKDTIRPYLPLAVINFYRYLRDHYYKYILPFVIRALYEFRAAINRIRERNGHSKLQKLGNTKEFNIEKLLSENWVDFKTDVHPKDRRMNILSKGLVKGMSTENIAFFINEIVKTIACKGVYLEVGTFNGYSLLSAALYNPSTRCIGIDNFSQFDLEHKNEILLCANLRKFGNPKNIQFYNMDYREGVNYLFSKETNLKVDVYYYDGEHSYENQLEGLRVMLPHLSEKCVIFVDDTNRESVTKANRDFVAEHADFKTIFKINTKRNGSPNWWNGFEIITRAF